MKPGFSLMGRLAGLGLMATLIFSARVSESGESLFWPMPGVELARQRALSIGCVNNLVQIRIAASAWFQDNGSFPATFQDFTNYFSGPKFFDCPTDVGRLIPTNWSGLDWSKVDYTWIQPPPGADTNVCCTCRIHTNTLHAGGWIQSGMERSGWPAIVAAPIAEDTTPGSDVHLEVRIAPDAQLPVSYQWRRERLFFTTNITFVTNQSGGYWMTNRVAGFSITNIAGQDSPTLSLHNVQTNDSDYYSVAVSNLMGTTASSPIQLGVDPVISTTANEYWSRLLCLNNLKQIALLTSIWSSDHDDHKPQSLSEMTNRFGLPLFGWPLVLFCRSDTGRTAPQDWPGFDFNDTSYEIVPGDEQNPYAVFCRCKAHGYYAQMDGSIVSAPHFTSINRTNNSSELVLMLFAGRTNVLEASTNLLTWSNLAMFSDTNGPVSFSETANSPQRFYRIRVP